MSNNPQHQLTGSEELSISDDFDSIAYLANGKSYTVGQYFGPNPEGKAAILAWHTKHLAKAREEGYRLGSQITTQDLLLHLPSELSTDRAMKLLKEYAALLKVYADIKHRHDTVRNGIFKDISSQLASMEKTDDK